MTDNGRRESPSSVTLSRRAVVSGLAAGVAGGLALPSALGARAAALPSAGAIPPPGAASGAGEELSLAARARRKGLIFGSTERQGTMVNNPDYQAAFIRDCAIMGPENELKFLDLRRTSSDYDFTAADWLFKFAQDHHMLFTGHVFVWGLALPQWARDVPAGKAATTLMVDHIWAVASRYRGKMFCWDVVNEAIDPNDGRPDMLRETYWLKGVGPDYIELAFRTAAEADPHAILRYNEFGLENVGGYYDRRREGTLKLLDRLVSKKVPIHALGTQSHLTSSQGRWMDEKAYVSFLDSVRGLGLRVMISEFDVEEHTLPTNIAERDHWVAKIATDYLAVTLPHPAVGSMVTWGLSDKYTYLNEFHPRPDGFPARPLPLDSAYQRKPLWWAIARAFDAAPERPPLTGLLPVPERPAKKPPR